MHPPAEHGPPHRLSRVLPLLVALTAAGLAGNFLRYPIFFSIEFLFGSVFSLLALEILGLGYGIVAALAVSSVTYVLWNHPYAVVIMACEVLVVGLLRRKRGTELVLADGIYWLAVGMPLVYLFYHVVMGLPPSNVAITMFKQALNGISNALLARLIFLAAGLRVQARRPSLRELVFNVLVLFALAPSLVVLAVQNHEEVADTEQPLSASLQTKLRNAFGREMVLVLGILAAALPLAELLSRRVGSSLRLLEDTEDRFQTLRREQETILNSAPVGIWLASNRRIVWTNPAHERLFGYTPEESFGMETAVCYVDPEDYRRVGTEGYAALGRGETYSIELEMRRRNGESFRCALTGRATDPEKAREGSIWVLQDVSVLHRTQALLQSVLDSAPVAVAWADQQGGLAYVNNRFREEIGYTLEDIPTLDSWFEHAYPDPEYRATISQAWDELYRCATSTGQSSFGPIEAWIRSKDGGRRCHAIYGGAIPDAHIAIFSDITARKEAEDKLRGYAEAQRVLLREVNHRVKNNLSAIIGLIHLELDRATGEDGEGVSRSLKDMESRVRALSIVHSMLSAAEWRPLRLRDLCEKILSSVLGPAGDAVRPLLVGDSPVLVDARQAHDLTLVLNELATNTAKHGVGEGAASASLEIGNVSDAVSLAYRDNGPGFPRAIVEGEPAAAGIGLMLVRGIVCQSLRGELELSNDGGAVVKIRFPKALLEGDDDAV